MVSALILFAGGGGSTLSEKQILTLKLKPQRSIEHAHTQELNYSGLCVSLSYVAFFNFHISEEFYVSRLLI